MAAVARQPAQLARRGHDLGANAVERLRCAEIPMTPLNFELWFRAEEYPGSPLASAVNAIEKDSSEFSQQHSADLAANFLPEYRLAREAKENGEHLISQLEAADNAMKEAQTSSRTYGLSLEAGITVLQHQSIEPASARDVIEQLARATSVARLDADRLNRQLSSALKEVSRLRDHMEVVRRESLTDALTNLPNRKAFDAALARTRAASGDVVVAMIDIDHFKRFNDQWGHATGDQVLKFVAAMIGRTAHAPRLAARYGGEEFAILFPGEDLQKVRQDLEHMLAQIRSRALTRRTTGERLGSLTVSCGLAKGQGASATDLLALADAALYASKRDGRDRVTVYDPSNIAIAS